MVLVFVGSARSMTIVITSIPLAILTAIVGLKLSGRTINTMTLGGIALAIGMLVDDATVEVENIHRNHVMNKPLLVAILDGAHQIATPTLVGTLSILHRLLSRRVVERCGALFIHAAGVVGRVRDADVLSAVANPCADDGFLLAARKAPGAGRQHLHRPVSPRIRGAF
jgi:hypothetical protein